MSSSDKNSESPKEDDGSKFDYSVVDPEKELICWGGYESGNSECDACPFKEKCEEVTKG